MNISPYPGSSSFSSGSTPFGFYDTDPQFQIDADKVTTFIARRLGYPFMEVELQDINFYTAFEEATTTYGNELYSYLVRDNMLTLTGAPISPTINNTIITPNLAEVVRMSQQYGSEAGVGGNVDYRSGSLTLVGGQQEYDLADWAVSQSIVGAIEIKKVYYQGPPALTRFYDPYAGTGLGMQNLMGAFGFSAYSPAVNFVLMPLSFDLAVIQQIEMNDMVRRSNYTFELKNNKLKIFPIPDGTITNYWFEYILVDDRVNNSIVQTPNSITNTSNVPYTNPTYTQINSIGRQWIFEYSLALCKEMLGYIRGKYSNIPIPDSEVTLNQSDLIAAATLEKQNLIDRLRTYLDETSKQKLLERKSLESGFRNQELGNIPLCIYIA